MKYKMKVDCGYIVCDHMGCFRLSQDRAPMADFCESSNKPLGSTSLVTTAFLINSLQLSLSYLCNILVPFMAYE